MRKTLNPTKIRQSPSVLPVVVLYIFFFFFFFLSRPSQANPRCEPQEQGPWGLLFQSYTMMVMNIRWIYEEHRDPVSGKKMLARILKRGQGYNRSLRHETFNFPQGPHSKLYHA